MAGREETAEWWALLPEGVRRQVGGYVLQDACFRAIRVVFEAGRARGLGLHEAQLVVHDRYLRHGDRVARTPDSPLDAVSLAARADGCPGRVVAIEAVWDGDTVPAAVYGTRATATYIPLCSGVGAAVPLNHSGAFTRPGATISRPSKNRANSSRVRRVSGMPPLRYSSSLC